MQARILHGTPITPAALLEQLAGESFCVSFADPRQLDRCIELQDPHGMLMLDNGAFTHWRQGKGAIDRVAFFDWSNAAQARCDVAVAVVPDVIGGSEEENWLEAAYAVRELSDYPERLMFVWHMNDSLDQLKRACMLFNFVAIGSCAEYDVQRNRKAYMQRLEEANATINYVEAFHERRPWIHLMRGVAMLDKAIRFESADSSNVARNHCRTKGQAQHVRKMADRIAAPIQATAAAAPTGTTYATSNFDLAHEFEEMRQRLAA
jgi:hypothetical protein